MSVPGRPARVGRGARGHGRTVQTGSARFRDRRDAGRALATQVAELALTAPVVLALPRGGVPVAAEVAAALGAVLDVFVVRKLGLPANPELGVGALAEGGAPLLDEPVLARFGLSVDDLASTVEDERRELGRRVSAYRGGRPLPPLDGRDVVLVDDGLATGSTARAALRALRAAGARRLVLAVPVGAPDTVRVLGTEADEVVCVLQPAHFRAVGTYYQQFEQTSDAEVLALLAAARG